MRPFGPPLVTRLWPIWARYAVSTVFVAVVAGIESIWDTGEYPYLLYLGAVILCATLFNHGTSIWAAVLGGAAASYFSLERRAALASGDRTTITGLALFLAIALLAGFLIELLHVAVFRLHQANEALRDSEREKDLLLRETAHRTKNDLSMVLSMIKLEERRAADASAKERLRRLSERITVFTRLQDRLTRFKQQPVVGMREYIGDLCMHLNAVLSGARPIQLQAHIEQHALPSSRAIAVGLIANELVTNALKHAFPDGQEGRIDVTFKTNDGAFILCVEDNGRGIPDDIVAGATHGLGQTLIGSMARQLGGEYRLRRRNDASGTIATVRFPRSLASVADEAPIMAPSPH